MRPQGERGPPTPEIIVATVYLKSKEGRSLLKEGQVAPGDPSLYLPAPETVRKAVTELERRGFNIEGQGVTLSISGPPQLFEQYCDAKIRFEETPYRTPGETRPRFRLVSRSSKPVMHIKGLEDAIDGIVLAIPGVPFNSSGSEE